MSNTMWGGGHRGPRHARRRTPGWFSWRPYAVYFIFLILFLSLNALRHSHDRAEVRHVTVIMLIVTVIGLPLILLGSWLFSRWLNWMHGRRS
jgi:uncharacterized membrane protein